MKKQSEGRVLFIRTFCSREEIRIWENGSHIPLEVFVTDNSAVCLVVTGLTWSAFEIYPSVRGVQRSTAT